MIEIDDGPIETIDETTRNFRRGKIGELMVTGPMVTRAVRGSCGSECDAQGSPMATGLASHG